MNLKQVVRAARVYTESLIWGAALILLFFMNTESAGPSLCLAKAAGFSWCPGCGLGHAVHEALHLNFRASLEEHILGIPATLALVYQIFKSVYIIQKNKIYGPATTY